jgi:hypothetical protein
MTVVLRRAGPLLLGLGAAVGVLLWSGPSLRGSAMALLCVAGAAAFHLSGRAPLPEPSLRLLGRIRLPPRIELAVVEVEGRRFLVASGATVTLLPPGDAR